MGNINVTIRMDEVLKEQADDLFEELGLTFTSAINAFVSQAIREDRIPFELTRAGHSQRGFLPKPISTKSATQVELSSLSERLTEAEAFSFGRKIVDTEDVERDLADELDLQEEADNVADILANYAFMQQRLGTLLSLSEFFEAEKLLYLEMKDRRNADRCAQVCKGLEIAGTALIPLVKKAMAEMIYQLKWVQTLPSDVQVEILDFDITGCDIDKLADLDACDIDVSIMLDRPYSEEDVDRMYAYEGVWSYIMHFYGLSTKASNEDEAI